MNANIPQLEAAQVSASRSSTPHQREAGSRPTGHPAPNSVFPLGVRVLVDEMAEEHLVIVYRPATPATVPTGPAAGGPV